MTTQGDLEPLRARLAAAGRTVSAPEVAATLSELGQVVSDSAVLEAVESLRRDSVGAGPLEPLLALTGVTDVLVNGPGEVYLDRGHGLELAGVSFGSEGEVRRLVTRLAASVGRRFDSATPFLDARLSDGTRVHAVLGDVTGCGTHVSLRVPPRRRFSFRQWIEGGSLPGVLADVLRRAVANRVPFLISGGTGSGKTSLLAAMLELVPPRERLVIVEDCRELAPAHPHCVRLEGRPPNSEGAGAVGLTELVRQALRMRPDRLVLGEVRGPEVVDLLIALNTGHEGGCGTVHANSSAAVPARLEALAALGGLGREAAHAQIAAALRLVVHVARFPGGVRRVTSIGVVCRAKEGLVDVAPALEVSSTGVVQTREALPSLEEMLR